MPISPLLPSIYKVIGRPQIACFFNKYPNRFKKAGRRKIQSKRFFLASNQIHLGDDGEIDKKEGADFIGFNHIIYQY